MYRFALLAFFLLALACESGDDGEIVFSEYHTDVARVLGDTKLPDEEPVGSYPRKRSLILSLEEERVNFFEIFSFDGCGLGDLLAQRNSILGRVMPASKRFEYEWRFYSEAVSCLASSDSTTDPEAYAVLKGYIALKQQNLFPALWNATFAGEEFRRSFSLSGAALEGGRMEALSYSLQRLADIALAVSENDTTSTKSMENHLKIVRRYALMGQLLQETELARHTLNRVSGLLKSALNEGMNLDQLRKLKALFDNHHVPLQTRIVYITLLARKTLLPLNQMYELMESDAPDAFKEYHNRYLDLEADEGLWQKLREARSEHDYMWQQLLQAAEGKIIAI